MCCPYKIVKLHAEPNLSLSLPTRTHALHLLTFLLTSHTSNNLFYTKTSSTLELKVYTHSGNIRKLCIYKLHTLYCTKAKWHVINVVFHVFIFPEPSSSESQLTPCPAKNTADNTYIAIRIRFKSTTSEILTLPHLRTHNPRITKLNTNAENRTHEVVLSSNQPLFCAILVHYYDLAPRIHHFHTRSHSSIPS